GRRNAESDEASAAIQKEATDLQSALMERVNAKEITMEEARAEFEKAAVDLRDRLSKVQWFPRDQMVPGFGNVGFKLKVGAIGISNYHATDSPFGWHIIKRYE
ncbi:MAG: peptidylprolyl isomerase, partial [Planctomycetota bacterium]|nr:peptidylprolyl isomerase [Planctomycetota bacterium]